MTEPTTVAHASTPPATSAGTAAGTSPGESSTAPVLPVGPWATGIGSLPGTDLAGAVDVVVTELGAAGLPFVPELPGRGVGADLIGRGAGFLVDLPVDLQPSGWRLVDRPGRDLRRSRTHWRDDLDALAERGGELAGARALKVSVVGPWTLAAALARPRGEAAVSDPGARRDIVDSLAEGVRGVLADVGRTAPGVPLVLQLDEPSVAAVLAGRLPTASGYGALRAVEPAEVRTGLRTVVDAAHDLAAVIMHSCAVDAPWRLLREAGADALAVPAPGGTTNGEAWESVAALLEDGAMVVLGVLDPVGTPVRPDAAARAVRRPLRDLGLPVSRLSQVAVSPTCGAAGATAAAAVQQLRVLTRAAEELAEQAAS